MAIQDFAGILNGVMWTQVALAIVFIGLRFYTRYFVMRSVGWDDIAMLVNLLTFIGFVVCISVGISYGIGKKSTLVDPASYSKAVMWEVIGQAICIMGIAASKASVALFLLRIVRERWHIAFLWFCIASTTTLCIITTALLFTQCKPTAFFWDRTIAGGECWLNFTKVGLTMGAWSAAMDFALAILPWHVVLGLNMKRKEKLTVACGLSLGIFAGTCSAIRTYELHTLSSVGEYAYDTVPMLMWSSTEVLVTMICACIPVLRPLYVKLVYGSRVEPFSVRSYPLNGYSKKGSAGSGERDSYGADGQIYIGLGACAQQTVIKNASEESVLAELSVQQAELRIPESTEKDIKRTSEIRIICQVMDSPV
ncbi:hypothetical protein BS50DRAFT_496366 [Corynespora cassiicola Philippines]|uniref:Rhodopsin domain-containing protein n=1 Tax=Corynespora cassiicola Philippines TaxID=1448308 RepID=A0A2T2NIT4_CORCC|nr:hypothetical protein BS50DRAFT_496366 [Corynespora cassiicola Philippines]